MMSGLKQAARAGLRRGVALVPLGLLRRWMPRELTALFYHAVSDERLPQVENLYPPLSVAQFEAALVYLNRHFNPVGYDDVHRWFSDGVDLPERAVHLSFDDGFGECCRVVQPLLQKHGVPCTFFVTTDWIDNQAMFYRNKVSLCIGVLRKLDRDALAMVLTSLSNALERPVRTAAELQGWLRSLGHGDGALVDMAGKMLGLDFPAYMQEHQVYLTSQQIVELAADGFTIGAHSMSHPKMNMLSTAEMEAEMVGSVKVVQELTGSDVVPFSFPHSAFGIERSVLADIRRRNPEVGLLFDTKGMQADEDFMVQRIWAEKAAYAHAGRRTNLPKLLKGAYADRLL